jgi:hypothetical protein
MAKKTSRKGSRLKTAVDVAATGIGLASMAYGAVQEHRDRKARTRDHDVGRHGRTEAPRLDERSGRRSGRGTSLGTLRRSAGPARSAVWPPLPAPSAQPSPLPRP